MKAFSAFSVKKILFILLLSPTVLRCLASTDTTKERKVHIIPVPVFYYAPETRFAFGVGSSFTFKLNSSATTNYSQVLAILAYTQNRQEILYFPMEIYTRDNNYYIDGEAGYFKYSYYYWGIGSDKVSKELYEVRYPRIIIDGYRKIYPNFYAGIDYNFVQNIMLSTDSNGVLKTGQVPGSKGYLVSGVGINVLYDTRDSIFFPTKGLFIKVASFFNSPSFGSTYTFTKLTTDISWYKRLSPSLILAMNQRNQFTYGDVPFDQLALVGGSKQMRGYYYGYYRDKYMTLLQAEARVHIHGPWGLAVFGASALIGHPGVFPDSGPIIAEGIGLRFNANRRQHINIRGDLGFGNKLEYYLSVEEAF